MGIDTHYYAVYGVKHKEYDADFVEEAYEHIGAESKDAVVAVIADGMGCDYVMVGKILFDSGNLRWSEFEDTLETIDIEKLPKYKEDAIAGFKNWMPSQYHKWLEGEWKLYVFAHYS